MPEIKCAQLSRTPKGLITVKKLEPAGSKTKTSRMSQLNSMLQAVLRAVAVCLLREVLESESSPLRSKWETRVASRTPSTIAAGICALAPTQGARIMRFTDVRSKSGARCTGVGLLSATSIVTRRNCAAVPNRKSL